MINPQIALKLERLNFNIANDDGDLFRILMEIQKSGYIYHLKADATSYRYLCKLAKPSFGVIDFLHGSRAGSPEEAAASALLWIKEAAGCV